MIPTRSRKQAPLRELVRAAALVATIVWFGAAGRASAESDEHDAAQKERSARSLASELARLRAEVEDLSDRVEARKTAVRAKLQSLSRQKSELEMQVRREEVRVRQLGRRRAEIKARAKQQKKTQALLEPVVKQGAERLLEAIERGLPFKRHDRTEEVERIVEQMERGLLTPAAAVARLWERVEDELRLGRENGIYSQVVPFGGSEQLVDVARLGMVLMYFRTRDGRYGLVERRENGWQYRLLSERSRWEPVAALFDALKKQIRTGFFKLPNGLPRLDASQTEEEEK